MLTKDRLSLLAIVEAIEKIQAYTVDITTADDFHHDPLRFDASMMNFVIIGEMIDRLSEGLKDQSPEIEWAKIKSFRNLVAHDYLGIDAEEVWQIIQNHLLPFQKQVVTLLKVQ